MLLFKIERLSTLVKTIQQLPLCVSKRTLENWGQGRRHPTGPARALLKTLDADPVGVMKALQR